MVLFDLIFRLLSNVILSIRNGCLPKFGHLQSTVNKLQDSALSERTHTHTHTLLCEAAADGEASKCKLMTSYM